MAYFALCKLLVCVPC